MMKRVGARHCPSLESLILRAEKRNCRCGVILHVSGTGSASFDLEYLADFEALRKKPSTEVDSSLMEDKEKSRSSFLYLTDNF